MRALLLPPLAHVIEGEEQQTCRQRFDYIFHASVQWKKRGLWGGHRLKKSLISNVHGIHARPRLGAAIPRRRVETHPGPLRYLFAALALSRTSAPDKTSLCLFVCALMHIIALPITRASAPSTTTSRRTTGAISTFVAEEEECKEGKGREEKGKQQQDEKFIVGKQTAADRTMQNSSLPRLKY